MPPKHDAKKEKQIIRPILGTIQYTLDKYSSQDAKIPDTPEQVKTLVEQLEKPIQQLIKAQSHDDIKHEPADEKAFTSLGAWLATEAPACFHGSRFRLAPSENASEGWGVVAARDLEDGEQFMNIPRRVCLSTDTALSSPVGAILKNDPMCLRMPSLFLAVHLLYEDQTTDSFWRPYLDCLPRTFTLPLFNTSPSTLSSWLQSSHLIYDIWSLQRSTIRQYLHLYGVLQKAGWLNTHSFTFESFRWAVAVVMSRQNRIPATAADRAKSPDQSVIALIPGWDFCNHRGYGKIATYFDVENDCSVSCTIEKVPTGSPIYLYYGARPNSKLYMFQGFVDSSHKSDHMDISLQFDNDDPLLKLKTLLLSKFQTGYSYQGNTLYAALPLPVELDSKPSTALIRGEDDDAETWQQRLRERTAQQQHLMTFARIAVLNKEEATTVLKNTKVGIVSPRNELAAFDWLHAKLTSLLSSYSTSVDDDTKLVTETSRSAAEIVAIQYRMSEKRLIADGLDTIKQWKTQVEQETES